MNGADLERRGFRGWIPLIRADRSPLIPTERGVYAVTYDLGRPAIWPTVSCGGWYKGKDPSVASSRLESKWIDNCDVVYIGKTDQTLKKRIGAFARYGRGAPIAHQGGRLIWQLPEVERLLVGWMSLAIGDAKKMETDLFHEFAAKYGRLPFANLRY